MQIQGTSPICTFANRGRTLNLHVCKLGTPLGRPRSYGTALTHENPRHATASTVAWRGLPKNGAVSTSASSVPAGRVRVHGLNVAREELLEHVARDRRLALGVDGHAARGEAAVGRHAHAGGDDGVDVLVERMLDHAAATALVVLDVLDGLDGGNLAVFDGSDGVLRFKQNFNGYIVRKMGTFRYYPRPRLHKAITAVKKLLGRA